MGDAAGMGTAAIQPWAACENACMQHRALGPGAWCRPTACLLPAWLLAAVHTGSHHHHHYYHHHHHHHAHPLWAHAWRPKWGGGVGAPPRQPGAPPPHLTSPRPPPLHQAAAPVAGGHLAQRVAGPAQRLEGAGVGLKAAARSKGPGGGAGGGGMPEGVPGVAGRERGRLAGFNKGPACTMLRPAKPPWRAASTAYLPGSSSSSSSSRVQSCNASSWRPVPSRLPPPKCAGAHAPVPPVVPSPQQ